MVAIGAMQGGFDRRSREQDTVSACLGEGWKSPSRQQTFGKGCDFATTPSLAEGVSGPVQELALKIANSAQFHLMMTAVITINLVVMIFDTNSTAACLMEGREMEDCQTRTGMWLVLDIGFLFIYAAELALRIVALQHNAVRNWNFLLDAVVVFVGSIEIVLSLVLASGNIPVMRLTSMLRILRVLRLARTARLLLECPQLASLVQGFFNALQTMGWGVLLILLLLLMISIVAVEVVAPFQAGLDADPDNWCADAFGSVWHCLIFFFQITVAGDSWGACAIPIIRTHVLTFVLFVGALCLVDLVFVNLILSAIIQTATEAHEIKSEEKKAKRLEKKAAKMQQLYSLCAEIDKDNSGTISLDELVGAFETNERFFDAMDALDVERGDLEQLFRFMDTDNSRDIDYQEFVDCMRRTHVQDVRMQMMALKLQVAQLVRKETKLEPGTVQEIAATVAKAVREDLSQLDLAPRAGVGGHGGQQLPMRQQQPAVQSCRLVGLPKAETAHHLVAPLKHPVARSRSEMPATLLAAQECEGPAKVRASSALGSAPLSSFQLEPVPVAAPAPLEQAQPMLPHASSSSEVLRRATPEMSVERARSGPASSFMHTTASSLQEELECLSKQLDLDSSNSQSALQETQLLSGALDGKAPQDPQQRPRRGRKQRVADGPSSNRPKDNGMARDLLETEQKWQSWMADRMHELEFQHAEVQLQRQEELHSELLEIQACMSPVALKAPGQVKAMGRSLGRDPFAPPGRLNAGASLLEPPHAVAEEHPHCMRWQNL